MIHHNTGVPVADSKNHMVGQCDLCPLRSVHNDNYVHIHNNSETRVPDKDVTHYLIYFEY